MRRDGWRVNLFDLFKTVRRMPFDQDHNNCIQFIASGYVLMRDDDPFKPFRRYKTFSSLMKAVKKAGYENHIDFFTTFLIAYDDVSQACVGDIAVFKTDDEIGYASGFVIGDRVFVLREDGLGTLALSDAIKAYRV